MESNKGFFRGSNGIIFSGRSQPWSTKEVFAGNQGVFDWIGRWQREDVPENECRGVLLLEG